MRAIVRRRGRAIGVTTVVLAGLGLFVVIRLPSEYRARAVVRIDDPRPSRDYVEPTVIEPAGDRLKSRRLAFIARPLVVAAAEATGIVPAANDEYFQAAERERKLAAMTARLDARQEGEDTFVLTYTDHDPVRAQTFLAALTQAYAADRARETAARAKATADFFRAEVEALRPRVAQADAVVEKYRLEHYGSLPEQLEGNLRMLDEVEMQTHALLASLDAARGRRHDVLIDAASPLRRQEEEVGRALSVARAKYAPTSAEVRNLSAELERVRAERRGDENRRGREVRKSSELRAVESEIARTEGRIDELRGREKELRGRIEEAARHGEALVGLTLDQEVLRERLRHLVRKHEEASLAAGLEAGVSGLARVSVVEPAWVTPHPVKPPRPFLAALALALALGLGLGVGYVLDATDRRVRAEDDARLLLGDVPLLGQIPSLSRSQRSPSGGRIAPRGEA